ncbi:hypothetical protein J437_LFUL013159, partial [Ladona fulva]
MLCGCPSDFIGNPLVSCVRPLVRCAGSIGCPPGASCEAGYCKTPCGSGSDCSCGEECVEGKCKVKCGGDNDCSQGQICIRGYCSAGCRSNNECPNDLACISEQCVSPCSPTACGTDAVCRASDHRAICLCPEGYGGEPSKACTRRECIRDEDCGESDKSCIDGSCRNPCLGACGANAQCRVIGRRANCLCPPGYFGNPLIECKQGGTCRPICSSDSHCIGNERCHVNVCRPQCRRSDDCRTGEICEGLVCIAGCHSDSHCPGNRACVSNMCMDNDCPNERACVNSQCVDPCSLRGACGDGALCRVVLHRPRCSCPHCHIASTSQIPSSEFTKDFASTTSTYLNIHDITKEDGGTSQEDISSTLNPDQVAKTDREEASSTAATNDETSEYNVIVTNVQTSSPTEIVFESTSTLNPDQVAKTDREEASSTAATNDETSEYNVIVTNVQTSSPTETVFESTGETTTDNLSTGSKNLSSVTRISRIEDSTTPEMIKYESTDFSETEKGTKAVDLSTTTDTSSIETSSGVVIDGYDSTTFSRETSLSSTMEVESSSLYFTEPNTMGSTTPGIPNIEENTSPLILDHDNNLTTDSRSKEEESSTEVLYPNISAQTTPSVLQSNITQEIPSRVDAVTSMSVEPPMTTSETSPTTTQMPFDLVTATEISGSSEAMTFPTVVYSETTSVFKNAENDSLTATLEITTPHDYKLTSNDSLSSNGSFQLNFSCKVDNDCLDWQTCIQYFCVSPCFFYDLCPANVPCVTEAHRPVCLCPAENRPSTIGCKMHPVIGCKKNSDCPTQLACLNEKCQSPCIVANPCEAHQECQMQDHQPVYSTETTIGLNISTEVPTQVSFTVTRPIETGKEVDVTTETQTELTTIGYETQTTSEGESTSSSTSFSTESSEDRELSTSSPETPQPCESDNDCLGSEACYGSLCQDPCEFAKACAPTAKCHTMAHRPVCTCPAGFEGDPAINCFLVTPLVGCTSNSDCPIVEACIKGSCKKPCDVHNPCAQNAVCVNSNHASDCSCAKGYHGNAFVQCLPVISPRPICQYNEDCPPHELCDRLNRLCINPCSEDTCGSNAHCVPVNHGVDCQCLSGFSGNPYVGCSKVLGCRGDNDCPTNEACINGHCQNPCRCGPNAACDVVNHVATCKCPPGYTGNPILGCQVPTNPCDPNPCGIKAMCEIDNGNPICFCPKGLTGNPFKNCIPEGDQCQPNPCGPNSGCRMVSNKPLCFCLPEYDGNPPAIPCQPPKSPCDPYPCGPNTQCTIFNGFAKCTCLPGFFESPNTVRGCVERKNPCEPNPCGFGALCDPARDPVCFCPEYTLGNPYKSCAEPVKGLCQPGPCAPNADCYVATEREECYCKPGYEGDPYTGCKATIPGKSPCIPNPCGPSAICTVGKNNMPVCTCPAGTSGDPTGPAGCRRPECTIDKDCPAHEACIGSRCRDPCPGSCGIGASCRVEGHHPVCTCKHGLTGNPLVRCSPIQETPKDPCNPSPCGRFTACRVIGNNAVCSCIEDYLGDPQVGCRPQCTINSDCPRDRACMNYHCQDPCPGVCGINALCHVYDHIAICTCPEGFTGDAFVHCIEKPTLPDRNVTDICLPSPCGPYSQCHPMLTDVAACDSCPDDRLCRPECLGNHDCPFDRACVGRACIDPCPGSCGFNAHCMVVNHSPICSCPSGFAGNPFEHCTRLPVEDKQEGCASTHCGGNAICREGPSGAVTCECRPGYFGNPYLACHPECVQNADCVPAKACINNKCVNPCTGACGVGALCDVVDHIPVCYCPPDHQGNPFVSCHPHKPIPSFPSTRPENPCDPSPCGPNSRCLVSGGRAICSCLPGYPGVPPLCRPECLVSSDCRQNQACINRKCGDPCPGTCGIGAECRVINHNPICNCPPGHLGDPFVNCYRPLEEEPKVPGNPCSPSPCGPNSACQVKLGRPVCSCSAGYIGSPPYCRPECVVNSECPANLACLREKCRDPCEKTCGVNARCDVVNHAAFCSCLPGYEGDAFVGCSKKPTVMLPPLVPDPCNPSPCGLNAQCRSSGGNDFRCSCIPPYIGDPYSACRPECTTNADCPPMLACLSQHCRDPCRGVCGVNAECSVVNHVPVCSCRPGYEGNPFDSCRQPIISQKNPMVLLLTAKPPQNPCEPSPCGPNSICRVAQGHAVCSCSPGHIGTPPGCRPECVVSSECPRDLACIQQKCKDPCPGTCGFDAICRVTNHNPICSCPPHKTGDPFNLFSMKIHVYHLHVALTQSAKSRIIDQFAPAQLACLVHLQTVGQNVLSTLIVPLISLVCSPSVKIPVKVPVVSMPIAWYTITSQYAHVYQDLKETHSQDVIHYACIQNKCVDPCRGTCGLNAECRVVNHAPSCSCLKGYVGNPLSGCHIIPVSSEPRQDPCKPSPCGSYSHCRVVNSHAVCSCELGYIGTPPSCRPECVVSADCAQDKACVGQRCRNPCPGTCGQNAKCQVLYHNPICSCAPGYTGDPFVRCFYEEKRPVLQIEHENPCIPSPCGPNSQCRVAGGTAACSCLPNYIGRAPNCRPECVINAECPGNRACQNERCVDPCPGSCGAHATCVVVKHSPVCRCSPGYEGDPFAGCSLVPIKQPVLEELNPCNPSPCGANAVCKERNGAGSCSCLPEYFGDPYSGCRPECVLNTDCDRAKTCLNNKCRDPCPGTCGLNAVCQVLNHAPSCSCLPGYMGNPLSACHLKPLQDKEPSGNPCMPSPCGPFSRCRASGGHAVCSCETGYIGTPPSCRPECVVSADCAQDKACLNKKCRDPCPGTCGQNTRCQVVNHNPICSCTPGYVGDPFVRCIKEEKTPVVADVNPCIPSPCGPNSQCRVIGNTPACSCLANYVGRAPNCRPECVLNVECPSNMACQAERCRDPCPGSCGPHAKCTVVNHSPMCTCVPGYTGDPFSGCSLAPTVRPTEGPLDPCNPSPCGSNAVCREKNGAGSCTCLPDYTGDPYAGCRPECVINTDCPRNRACLNQKCRDPCPGTCGLNAECRVVNHAPSCTCLPGYVGEPLSACKLPMPIVHEEPKDPCQGSPCGPNARCRVVNGHAVCSCLSGYVGTPPSCRPECVVSTDCPQNLACLNLKCRDPCPGTCGQNARCQTVNHNPICSCPSGYTVPPPKEVGDPCSPSPCGPHSQCRVIGSQPACSCLPNRVGRPPNCRPECVINAECPSNLACRAERCGDPCPGSCGRHAQCVVVKHSPVCTCPQGYTGDPFSFCSPALTPTLIPSENLKPCNPSPCGVNAVCREKKGAGACSCLPDYYGDPYTGCRPQCVLNTDCPRGKACLANKCTDPCPGTCALNAHCTVPQHSPSCNCNPGYTGDPFRQCTPIQSTQVQENVDPCKKSPCGPYSICRNVLGRAVCSCQPGCIGSPPSCRPECSLGTDCPQLMSCIGQRCRDPCPGTCGFKARCTVVNHKPLCSCLPGYTGDAFKRCFPIATTTVRPKNPCEPNPCGPNSECRLIDGRPACTCQGNFIGTAPNCHPECVKNSDCPNNRACLQMKCRDPCPGHCGINAQCAVVNHKAKCSCPSGFSGNPMQQCTIMVASTERTPVVSDPCFPSPCGNNAICREFNGAGACSCLPGFEGDPYTGCRRECETNKDCTSSKACVMYKCNDPCPGTCGPEAICKVLNHIPTCNCPPGFIGDPFFQCRPAPKEPLVPREPCRPSPCGPNSQCRVVNEQAVCSCLQNYIGAPPNCRPECIVSSECPADKACINQRCADPCQHTCGIGAKCSVRNHSPICACPPRYTGDPFTQCLPIAHVIEETPTERPPSCIPNPCGPNSECRLMGGVPACSCLPSYIGTPPSCRPECTINAECPSHLACIKNHCQDPCPGSCGVDASCRVINHTPVCTCDSGYSGDPFVQCSLIPSTTPTPDISDPCNPSPCGPNAVCTTQGSVPHCECSHRDYVGNPYEGCRPECVLGSDCDRNKACVRNKCINPCPGTCGIDARCDVINHIPTCSCPEGYTGDPFAHCRPEPKELPQDPVDPCRPSPCGPNSQCRVTDAHAVCSCVTGYIGTPPSCRPECIVSSECPISKACVNQKCTDPCIGSCGVGARCEVINHSPICSCRQGQTGDPFKSCYDIPPLPPQPVESDPCNPSPCGPNSECRAVAGSPACSCLKNYVGVPPNCRPECVINPDCPPSLVCMRNKCKDPCPASCGSGAECRVISHAVTCACPAGYTGDPFVQCGIVRQEVQHHPCEPSPCGANAECKQRGEAGACSCIEGYFGNPYEGCRPECVLSSDCQSHLACVRNKCTDPCPGVCGLQATCSVVNHVPTCTCIEGYIGDPFTSCHPRPIEASTQATVVDPCSPSPCGPNSQCREVNGQAVCSCKPTFVGSPPNCKPECVVNTECPLNQACSNFKCRDPCPGTCGLGARCEVVNHNPICGCPAGLTVAPPPKPKPANPCVPSPCGPNSECRAVGDSPACSCRAGYIGAPPNCRPECVVNSECPSTQACIAEKCRDPCPGSCGLYAECRVQNHIPTCTCQQGYSGDPFIQCSLVVVQDRPVMKDPCHPSPCGPNADCTAGQCKCITNYFGDPYQGCRPECVLNSDCARDRTCISQRCVDPCPGTCGQGANCDVVNHIPTCSCPPQTSGDPFIACRHVEPVEASKEPCNPSPCGPNSICREVDGHAVCSCMTGFIGSPPTCHPECVSSAECPLQQACLGQKCRDPCPGTCGQNARCQVVNHNPICSCSPGMTGDPFVRCYTKQLDTTPAPPTDPCRPSPCGPNSECHVRGESPACSCLNGYIGLPPNCRPECVINPECDSRMACVGLKCRDPCPGSCGQNAKCRVVNHNPICECESGYTGDPFSSCQIIQVTSITEVLTPCIPSPCGANAVCKERNGAGSCVCLPEYIGNPYEGCRPECVLNSECPTTKACIRSKCQDPCLGVCGQNAVCEVVNHSPMCTCLQGFIGDAFIPVLEDTNPCEPSPCGPYSRCREIKGQAVCSCLPNHLSSPPTCRPECITSSECASERACVDRRCKDPCPGPCGLNTICNVINHSPICSCKPGYTGDPFVRCNHVPPAPSIPTKPIYVDPCVPSPCGQYAECKDIGGSPSCSCKREYIGRPPNCKPECVISAECPTNKACMRQKCRDPCPGSCEQEPVVAQDPCHPSPCGPNAQCRDGICSCFPEYQGDPYVGCRPECVLSNDCPRNKACVRQKCVDPCPGTCGQNARCEVVNHIPMCSCPERYSGNPFVECRPYQGKTEGVISM